MSSKKKFNKHPHKSNKPKNKPKPKSKPKPKPKPKSKPKTKPKPKPSSSSSNSKSKPNSFVYGFKVHSLSQVSQPKPPKKNKKTSPAKTRNKQQSSPFSTASSTSESIELYTSSVTKLLNPTHLDASSATSLHDLQSGTATIALQTFLSYPNLRRVFGIEQNKNLFHWATQNLMALIKNGYQNHKYLLVEQIPSIKMTIAEKASASELQSTTFAVGDVVYCFIPLKQNNIKKRDNYQAIIRYSHPDGIHYDVEMSTTKSVVKRVHRESIFKPGQERTFEICRGNLFERSDSFRADIILLPYSISNDSFRSLLLTGCKRSPITSRILSFSHLESWDGFPAQQLRRIDANVYDNDRYDTNLSPFHKLYIYSHVLSSSLGSAPKEVLSDRLKIGDDITIRDVGVGVKAEVSSDSNVGIQWFAGKVLGKDVVNKTIMVEKDGFILDRGICEIKADEQRIHIISRRFSVGDLVTAYCPKMIESGHADLYTLYHGQIVCCNNNGTYGVQFEDGETPPKVHESYIFERNKAKYGEGDVLHAYRYDKIKQVDEDGELINIKKKYLSKNNKHKFKIEQSQCIVRHINANGTYRVEFMHCNQHYLHDVFCESWLKKLEPESDEKSLERTYRSEPKLPLLFEVDYDKVLQWKANIVSHWLKACGVSCESAQILVENHVNGVFLFELDINLLIKDMKIGINDAHRILRYTKCLKHKLQYNMNENNEQDEESERDISLQYELEIQQYQVGILQIKKQEEIMKEKLKKLIHNKSNSEEYIRYKEWELKLQCMALRQKKMSNKEIAAQLKKTQTWVKKTCKLKPNQIKKPGGNIIKQVEGLQAQILKFQKQIKEKQNQILCARQKLAQLK